MYCWKDGQSWEIYTASGVPIKNTVLNLLLIWLTSWTQFAISKAYAKNSTFLSQHFTFSSAIIYIYCLKVYRYFHTFILKQESFQHFSLSYLHIARVNINPSSSIRCFVLGFGLPSMVHKNQFIRHIRLSFFEYHFLSWMSALRHTTITLPIQ